MKTEYTAHPDSLAAARKVVRAAYARYLRIPPRLEHDPETLHIVGAMIWAQQEVRPIASREDATRLAQHILDQLAADAQPAATAPDATA